MKKGRIFAGIATLLMAGGLLAGCGNQKQNEASSGKVSFPVSYSSKGNLKKGGTLKVGLVDANPFKGVFVSELCSDQPTTDAAQFGEQALIKTDENNKFIDGGVANIKFDNNAKTATITINPKAKWSDGQPVTSRDVEFTYEIIANKDSNSTNYTDDMDDIIGLKAYHEGKASSISGLETPNDRTLIIHFKEMRPSMKTAGNSYIVPDAQPYHYLKDIPISKLASSDRVRTKPLFYGPFKIKKIVQGESIEWVPNPYYWGKKPNLNKIDLQTVSPSQAAAALKAKKYDILLEEPASVYGQTKNLSGYTTVGKKENAFTYLGFKVGHADANGNSVMDSNAITQNRSLRLALAYAMNIDQVDKKLGNGVTYRANTVLPDSYKEYHDNSLKGFPYNLKKANELLDQAGFKKGKDGYRTQPNGKKLTLTLMAHQGDSNTEAVVQDYIQQWKKIGIRVKLYNGRLQEFNTFNDKLLNDASGYDMWLGGWATGTDPDPSGLYAASAPYNYGHFVTQENTDLLNAINSPQALNDSYRKQQFYKWQAYMNKEAYVVPLSYDYQTVPVSNKVKNFTLDNEKSYTVWENVSLTN